MSIQVNSKGKSFGNGLISAGKIDSTSSWSFSGADGNKLLGPDGDKWSNFAKHHLAEDTEQNEETKTRWKYPFAKMKGDESVIFRRGVIAAKSRAAQQGQTDISNAADDLLQAIDKKLEKDGIDLNDLNEKLTDEEKDVCGTKKKKRKTGDVSMTNQSRVDFMFEDLLTERFTETPEGFLSGRAIITNIGVFPYLNKDGKVIRELRPPEEVLAEDSLRSLQMSPLTNDHPDVAVDVNNIKDLQAGFIGDGILSDPYHVSGPITITDKKAIKEVKEKGKRALSAGYTVDLEKKSGVWGGTPYDYVQKNIRYNHVAIVDRGRAGDRAVMKLDSVDGVHQIEEMNSFNIDKQKVQEKEELMKTIIIDGVEYQAEAKVIEELHKAQAKSDELNEKVGGFEKENAKLQGKCDSLEDENTQLKSDNEKLKETEPEKFDAAVQGKIELISSAKNLDVEVESGDSNLDIKKKVILKAYPNTDGLKEKLDSQSVDYVEARYDAAVELLKDVETVSKENKKKTLGNDDKSPQSNPRFSSRKDRVEKADAEASRNNMLARYQNAYKRDKEE